MRTTSVFIEGDCMDALAGMSDSYADAIVTDPPYGLGFMGKAWDDLPPGEDFARECRRVLKPGGHLLAFGGTRTYHRLACALEDAGLTIRDTLAWLYGSGFPKSHNLADEWEGWGTALKPAFEPIVLARRPFPGTVAANVRAHGTGALNVQACRLEARGEDHVQGAYAGSAVGIVGEREAGKVYAADLGRWPANVLLDEDTATMLDARSGELGKSAGIDGMAGGTIFGAGAGLPPVPQRRQIGYGDTGGASRFFYVAKASSAERNAGLGEPRANHHPTVKPVELMRWLVRLITPAGGIVVDPFAGTGTTGIAAHLEGFGFVGIEREDDYVRIARARMDYWRRMPAGIDLDAVLRSEREREALAAIGQLELVP